MENIALYQQIIAAGRQAGLFIDDGEIWDGHNIEVEGGAPLTELVVFTLRPVEEYLRHYRGSWTDMVIQPVAAGDWGDDEQGEALIFQTHFRLAYSDGGSPEDPGVVIADVMDRVMDFAESYPVEAARLFTMPFGWDMYIQGEMIYQPGEDDWPILDFGMTPKLSVYVEVYETTTVADFAEALTTLSDDSPLGKAIQQAIQQLALLFRWLDTEMPPRPPLLDLLD